ncbi:MAG: protein kinase, partial [Anaerolineae bacterium]|nr:protein kinase [Phycisphaerae bacterium]
GTDGTPADPSTNPFGLAPESWNASGNDAALPESIGPYRILARVGEGGIGIVYKAEQREPVKRVVALKIIKLGMDTREVVQRFAAERQALAMMDHPNVARVFDAGSTPTGRPFFVMELVAGEPITDYCDRHSLTVRQRLELFQQICGAVQHAHQKGIIHRDLKPSNILVGIKDGKAHSKVIDFGIAKAISSRLTDNTLYTEQGQLIGTPEYMSPEQAEMSAVDIDTRADIYSLGVLLYELLAGAPPIDAKTLRRGAYAEIQRMIREVDPPSPSLRVTRLGVGEGEKIAERRRISLPALAAELKGELEWIPLKAMRKDRTERYQTATELSIDVQNYLEGLPLIAGPESQIYRARKFVRRNKLVVGACTVFVMMLVGVSITLFMLLKERSKSQQMAQERAQIAEERREALELKASADRGAAEAARLRDEAQKQQQAANIALQEMVKNLRFVSPEQRQQIITSGVFAVIAKDPSMLAGLMKQLSEKPDPSAGAAPSRPATTRPTAATKRIP